MLGSLSTSESVTKHIQPKFGCLSHNSSKPIKPDRASAREIRYGIEYSYGVRSGIGDLIDKHVRVDLKAWLSSQKLQNLLANAKYNMQAGEKIPLVEAQARHQTIDI